MLIFKREDVFSWSNAKQAESYKDKNGYFTCHYSDNLKDWDYGTLGFINYDMPIGDDFYASYANSDDYMGTYGLFIPEDKVTVTPYNEDGFRAFNSVEEFESVIKPMTVFEFARINDIKTIYRAIYVRSVKVNFKDCSSLCIEIIVPFHSVTNEEINEFINNYQDELPPKWNKLHFSYDELFDNYRLVENDEFKYFGINYKFR